MCLTPVGVVHQLGSLQGTPLLTVTLTKGCHTETSPVELDKRWLRLPPSHPPPLTHPTPVRPAVELGLCVPDEPLEVNWQVDLRVPCSENLLTQHPQVVDNGLVLLGHELTGLGVGPHEVEVLRVDLMWGCGVGRVDKGLCGQATVRSYS